MASITIYGNTPSKKNSRNIFVRGGKICNIPSKTYADWHKTAIPQIQIHKLKFKGRVQVDMILYPKTNVKGDVSNKGESIMDSLVDAGVIEDDNWFICPDVHMVFGGVDKDNPRAVINIFSLEDDVAI